MGLLCLVLAASHAHVSAVPARLTCAAPQPLCLRGAGRDTRLRKYEPEDPQSGSAAACCAAAISASAAGCTAWQLISKSEGAPPACWLMATTVQKSGAAGESCVSAALVAPPPAARTNRTGFSGIWLQHGSLDDIVNQTFVVGGDLSVKWGDVETADDEWDWAATDALFASAPANGFWIETALEVGPVAPAWIYTEAGGVPPVNITPSSAKHDNQPAIFPNYLDPTYQRCFLRAIDRFAAHIATLPAAVRAKIVASQAMFGSTGDDCPWHGCPIGTDCTKDKWGLFTDDAWHYFTMSLSPTICASYAAVNMSVLWNTNISRLEKMVAECPRSYIKAGMVSDCLREAMNFVPQLMDYVLKLMDVVLKLMDFKVSHSFQVNGEVDNYLGGYHCRGESWPFASTGTT